MPLLMTHKPSPFGQSSPWAARRTPPLAAVAGAQAWLVSMTAASKQEAAQPLSEHYSEWLNACTLAKWMDRLISKGHTLQFTSVPPRFNGIVETMLSSKGQQLSLLAELQQLLAKKVISTVPKGEEMQGFYSRYFLLPKRTEGLRPILDLALFNKCIAERPVHMSTIRRVLQCVKPADWSPQYI